MPRYLPQSMRLSVAGRRRAAQSQASITVMRRRGPNGRAAAFVFRGRSKNHNDNGYLELADFLNDPPPLQWEEPEAYWQGGFF